MPACPVLAAAYIHASFYLCARAASKRHLRPLRRRRLLRRIRWVRAFGPRPLHHSHDCCHRLRASVGTGAFGGHHQRGVCDVYCWRRVRPYNPLDVHTRLTSLQPCIWHHHGVQPDLQAGKLGVRVNYKHLRRTTGQLLCYTSLRPLYTIVLLLVCRDIHGVHCEKSKHPGCINQ